MKTGFYKMLNSQAINAIICVSPKGLRIFKSCLGEYKSVFTVLPEQGRLSLHIVLLINPTVIVRMLCDAEVD